MSWFAKWFWECWFELDNVHLHGSRRDYLEYKMGTIKLYNARNNFLHSWFVQIPYYVFLGCSRQRDASAASKAFELEAGSRVGVGQGGLMTPVSPFITTSPFASPNLDKTMAMSSVVPDFSLGPSAIPPASTGEWEQTIRDVGAPLSPFHYQLRKVSLTTTEADDRPGVCPISRKRSTNSSAPISTAG